MRAFRAATISVDSLIATATSLSFAARRFISAERSMIRMLAWLAADPALQRTLAIPLSAVLSVGKEKSK
jgi:hypothetical protein